MPLSPCIELGQQQQRQLLEIARRSIEQGFATQAPLRFELADLDTELRKPAAVFVTLTEGGELRGCIGSLQADAPLAQAVANAAYNSAFRDYRFTALKQEQLQRIRIEISVLSPLQRLHPESREALLQGLQPGVDGLVIEDRGRRATFLPKVWEKIDSPADFLDHLLQKAGLAAGYWSASMSVERYRTLTFDDN
jgi:AmmeMemoRadiSam system protein A